MKLLTLFLLVGCRNASESTAVSTPDGAFRLFSQHLRKTDDESRAAKAAFALLSKDTRARLEANSKSLSASSQGLVPDDPALLTFRTPQSARPLLSVTVASADDTRATLEVHTCQEPLTATGTCPPAANVQERVTMVKEAQGWAVELPDVKP